MTVPSYRMLAGVTVPEVILYAGAMLVLLLTAFALPSVGERAFRRIETIGGRMARRRWLAVVAVGTAPALCRLLLIPAVPVPQPVVHDEFSYLLAGDTYAAGRLTNSTHPHWISFETFHVSQRPTYMSMYFPAQGMILAMGKALFGHPWFGVCISVGIMCGATCWMLQGWLSPGWALIGGILAVCRLGIFSYWMNSYWGGAAAATGGALVLGAVPRLMRRPRAGTALILGAGLAILANSRPFEGLLIGIPTATALLLWAARGKRPSRRALVLQVLAPLAAVGLLTTTAMAYYNWRAFGSPLTLPYQLNRATYAVSPVFIWQTPRPAPPYRHAIMRDFYLDCELPVFKNAQTGSGFLEGTVVKAGLALAFYYGPVLLIPLVTLRYVARDRRIRFLVLTGVVFAIGQLGNAFHAPHYFAPAASLAFAVLVQSMRHLRTWKPDSQPVGRALVRLIPLTCIAVCAAQALISAHTPHPDLPRTRVALQLERLPGEHLAFVRYSLDHDPRIEWVYNAADIDGAKVVWAHEVDDSANRALVRYFQGRRVWLVEPDRTPASVSPYPLRQPESQGGY